MMDMAELNEYFSQRSYLASSPTPTQQDIATWETTEMPDPSEHPHLARWWHHIAQLRLRFPWKQWPAPAPLEIEQVAEPLETEEAPTPVEATSGPETSSLLEVIAENLENEQAKQVEMKLLPILLGGSVEEPFDEKKQQKEVVGGGVDAATTKKTKRSRRRSGRAGRTTTTPTFTVLAYDFEGFVWQSPNGTRYWNSWYY